MIRTIAIAAALLAATACSTTSVMHSGYQVAEGQKFTFGVSNTSEISPAGLAELRTQLGQQLAARGLAASGAAPDALEIDVRISNYYMRNSAARFLVGVMAGRDSIRSTVTVKRADGQQMGLFDVESYNSTALGTSSGLIEEHATEIVDRVASLKSVANAAPALREKSQNEGPAANATQGGMKWKPKRL